MICESILLPVLGYFYCPNYELLFTCKLQVTVYYTSCELYFIYKLQFVINCTIYKLLFNYEIQKDKDNKAAYDNKVIIKNYFLGSLLYKELGTCYVSFSCS